MDQRIRVCTPSAARISTLGRFATYAIASLTVMTVCSGATATPAVGDTMDVTLTMPVDSLQISVDESGWHRFRMDGAAPLGEVGNPDLLTRSARIILPAGSDIDTLEVVSATWTALPGIYKPGPAPRPETTSQASSLGVTPANPAAYGATKAYPSWTARLCGNGTLRGASTARLEIAPVRWTAQTGVIEVLSEVTLRAYLKSSSQRGIVPSAAVASDSAFLQRNIVNTEDIEAFKPAQTVSSAKTSLYQPGFPAPNYVIIVPEGAMATEITPLADWLTASGQPADVVTVEWILSTYSTPATLDSPARVREFLVDAYTNYGIEYVLLAGDYDEVPTRDFRSSHGGNPLYYHQPTDFYYSDLDVDHNGDGDEFWFERYEDYPANYELIEDVYVGRIPAQDAQMIEDYLDKWFAYVEATTTDYQTNILYAADHIYNWSHTIPWFENYVEPICNQPPYDVTKLYTQEERWPPPSPLDPSQGVIPLTIQNFINHVSAGQGLVFHAAHSGHWAMEMGDGYFRNDDIAQFTNLNRYGVMYSLGCSVQPWDYDQAIGEDLVMTPDKGMIASVANSDVGWWTTQMTGVIEFARSVIEDGHTPVAQNMIDAKQFSIWMRNSNADPDFWTPWGKCSVNLLGEPSFAIWTDSPTGTQLDVSAARITSTEWTVTASLIEQSPTPTPVVVPDAKVCVSGGNVYLVGYTNASGTVTFTVENPSVTKLNVMATARNFVPAQKGVKLPTVILP